uniref:Uncharacterized protein n=1 Tax=Anopheles farauti TaxID=69004 RepID=A0A182QKZ2_9DIPT
MKGFRIDCTKTPIRPSQMETEKEALTIVAAHVGKHSLTHDGKKYIAMFDESTEIFVLHLPFGVPTKDVGKEMALFVEVLSIKRGVWHPKYGKTLPQSCPTHDIERHYTCITSDINTTTARGNYRHALHEEWKEYRIQMAMTMTDGKAK